MRVLNKPLVQVYYICVHAHVTARPHEENPKHMKKIAATLYNFGSINWTGVSYCIYIVK